MGRQRAAHPEGDDCRRERIRSSLRSSAASALRCSADTLVEALHGRVREHHRFLLDQHLKTIEQLEATIAAFDARIEAALAPFRGTVERLKAIPGLCRDLDPRFVTGRDRSRHEPVPDRGPSFVLGWPRASPRRERRQAPLDAGEEGCALAQAVLVQCAWAAARTKNSYFQAQFLRLKSRRGPEESGGRRRRLDPDHRLSHARDGTCYQDLGPAHFTRRDPARAAATPRRPHPQPRLRSRNPPRRMTQPPKVQFLGSGVCLGEHLTVDIFLERPLVPTFSSLLPAMPQLSWVSPLSAVAI